MPPSNVIEFVSKAEREHMLGAIVLLPLARLIETGKIDPETVTRSQFFAALKVIGKSHDTAYEFYVDNIPEQVGLIAHCVATNAHSSAIVLLFTLIESEINALVRIHLRIKGFTNNAITDALQGTDFDTKLNILLSILDVTVPPRLRNSALQCKAVRNMVVHNKATPSLLSRDGEKLSDSEAASERAVKYFKENPLPRMQRDLQKFVDDGVYESWAVQWASIVFNKYYVDDEA